MTEERFDRIETKIDKVLDGLSMMGKETGKHGADIDNLKKSFNRSWAVAVSLLISAVTMLYTAMK